MKPKLEKWDRWLAEIKDQIRSLLWSRQIYRETFEIIVANPEVPQQSSFYAAIQMWYAASLLSGVRRQVKSSEQSISMLRLLEEISESPELLDRKHWQGLLKGTAVEPLANSMFDNFASGADSVSASTVSADIASLKAIALTCETYADKRLAHHDRGKEPNVPTYEELNATLEELSRVFQKYHVLVTGIHAVTETAIAHNWKRVFEVAWKPREQPG